MPLRASAGNGAERREATVPQLSLFRTEASGLVLPLPVEPKISAILWSSRRFENPQGPSGMVVSGVGTKVFNWGDPMADSSTNRVRFNGAGFAGIPLDEFFVIGDLTYRNGTTFLGTEADSVDLLVSLVFAAPIQFTSLFPSGTFVLKGIEYTLKTGFGSVENGGFARQASFLVFEDRRASVELIGRITAAKPVPDAGSTLALMAIAIAALGGLRHYLTARAVVERRAR
jgi:VPDSG-CTERM motif